MEALVLLQVLRLTTTPQRLSKPIPVQVRYTILQPGRLEAPEVSARAEMLTAEQAETVVAMAAEQAAAEQAALPARARRVVQTQRPHSVPARAEAVLMAERLAALLEIRLPTAQLAVTVPVERAAALAVLRRLLLLLMAVPELLEPARAEVAAALLQEAAPLKARVARVRPVQSGRRRLIVLLPVPVEAAEAMAAMVP
jgi:hypothetical protein